MPSRAFTRHYEPRLARLTALERAYIGNNMGEDAAADFLLPTKYIEREDLSDVLGKRFQIVYNFPWTIRDNRFPRVSGRGTGTYGASGLSYRMLYETLCDAYNGGEYFLDRYFRTLFPMRFVGEKYFRADFELRDKFRRELYEKTMDLPRRKDGVTPDMRYARKGLRLRDFAVLREAEILETYTVLAREIRDDIIVCLSTGKLVTRTVSGSTSRRRRRLLGMKSFSQFFYASGRLIEHLNVYVNVSEYPG
jgi:hypothetical protein